MHILYNDIANDTVNDTVKIENDPVLALTKENSHIKAAEINERLNISLSTLKRKIKALKDKGILERIGSDKTGHWKITKYF